MASPSSVGCTNLSLISSTELRCLEFLGSCEDSHNHAHPAPCSASPLSIFHCYNALFSYDLSKPKFESGASLYRNMLRTLAPQRSNRPQDRGLSDVGILSKRTLDMSYVDIDEHGKGPAGPDSIAAMPQSHSRKRCRLAPNASILNPRHGTPLSSEANPNESHSAAHITPFLLRTSTLDFPLDFSTGASEQRSPLFHPCAPYEPRPIAARPVLPPLAPPPPPPLVLPPAPQYASTTHLNLYAGESPPWHDLQACNTLTVRGEPVQPVLHLTFEKGFFLSGDYVWSMYRRNYFVLRASFSIDGPEVDTLEAGDISISEEGQERPVSGFLLRLRAEIKEGQPVNLIQHTSKRDKGPSFLPTLFPITPSAPISYNQQGLPSTVQWERCQFKTATRANGKRRAQQQYYHAVVELLAMTGEQSNSEGICLARRKSHPFVVRGRSPSYYHNEGPHKLQSGQLYPMPPPSLLTSPMPPWSVEGIDHAIPSPQLHPTVDNTPTGLISGNTQQRSGSSPPGRVSAENFLFTAPPLPAPQSMMGSQWPIALAIDATQLSEFVSDFLGLSDIEKLCMDCSAVSTWKRCELNFRQLLRSFGSSLATESKSNIEQEAARTFRRMHNRVAARIMDVCRAKKLAAGIGSSSPIANKLSSPSRGRELGDHDAMSEAEPLVPDGVEHYPSNLIQKCDVRPPADGSINDSPMEAGQQGRDPVSTIIEFIRTSDALEVFREELLDLRIAQELTRKKVRSRTTKTDGGTPDTEMPPATIFGTTISTLLRGVKDGIQSYFQPALQQGVQRLSWRCVSPLR